MIIRAPDIYRSRIHEEMVQRLAVQKIPDSDRTLFPTIRELLCFAALLGFSEMRRLPLDRKAGVEDVSYQRFEMGDSDDLIYLIALAETKDPKILNEGEEKKCAEIFEEYANGGLHIIQDAINKGGGEYLERDIFEMLMERGYLSSPHEDSDMRDITF